MTTYAVTWRVPGGQTFVGRLALGPGALRLEGRRRGAEEPAVERRLGYGELRGLRVGTRRADRLDGRPTVVVESAEGPFLVAGAVIGAPIVHELADRLAVRRLAVSTGS